MRLRICKILSPLLLLPLLLPVLVVLIITFKREHIRHEIKEQLEEGVLHTIRLKNNEFAWVKAGKEICINGRMFDVKKYASFYGETEFTGLFDEEETELNNVADNLLNRQSQKNNILLSQLVQLLSGCLMEETKDQISSAVQRLVFPPANTGNLPFIYRTIITPPPLG